ncbi:ferrochelatase [Flaviflexus massiliensis]|uniref:ferrochelatase n=1 Tax=Flaviflexus massiliensis TaxID=1522309 RepID=UPI0006D55091|nr:ferrochelatase [Flaviflexus massiliensis]
MPDAYLVLSYGGPNKPEDVVPFLRNATAGKGIPDERLEQVGEHYYMFGGKSPINELNAELVEYLRDELARRGDTTPVVIGNRNWEPYGNDVIRELYDSGARDILAIATSAYDSYSSCRQYREDIARWLGELDLPDLSVRKTKPFWNSDGFLQANRDAVRDALEEAGDARLVFVTHSIPTAMNTASGTHHEHTYQQQHEVVAKRIADDLGIADWDLAYCSRSGSPHIPWLEPDICDHLEDLHGRGSASVVLAPIGFISDHMEVKFDLDTEAKAKAEELGMGFVRAATVGVHPAFISQLADILQNPGDTSYAEDCCWAGPNPPTVPAIS